jgi:hypothetical protein
MEAMRDQKSPWIWIALALASCAALSLLEFFRPTDHNPAISIPQKRCQEICVEVLQRRGVFPSEYRESIDECKALFPSETCELRSK